MPNLFSHLRGNRCCCALFTIVLVCLNNDRPLVMWKQRNLKLSSRSTIGVDVNGGVLGPLFPVVNDQQLCLTDVEGDIVALAPHCQVSDLLPIGCLIVSGDQAYHRLVNGKLNDGVGVVLGLAVMGEQGVQQGTKHKPLRGPVLRISVAYVLLPTLTTWGRLVRKSMIQMQREVFSPRVLSLVMSFEGTIVLNAEL